MTLDETIERTMRRADATIAEGDTMFTDRYMDVSASALRAILAALHTTGTDVQRVLDFGCGYGRVLRAIRAAFPDAHLFAADLNAEALHAASQMFNATPIEGNPDISQIDQVTGIDLVWCGSVLTHLDAPRWAELWGYFHRALAPNGVVVATTHGRRVAERLAQGRDYGLTPEQVGQVLNSYRSMGFGYVEYSPGRRYGISLATPGWAIASAQTAGFRVRGYDEAGWDNHQDVLHAAISPRFTGAA